MLETTLGFVYVSGLVIVIIMRLYYWIGYRKNIIEETRREGPLMWLSMFGWGVGLLLPLFVFFGTWLEFASYTIPVWLRWVGATILFLGVWFLWRAHADLGRNWSATLEIRKGQNLVSDGVYKHMRHPIYSAHFVITIGIALMVPNWLAGLLPLVSGSFAYLLRVADEEKMMLDKFGEQYRSYMRKTSHLWPKRK